MNIDDFREQLEELAGPRPRATSDARAAVQARVQRARRRRTASTAGGSALAALLVVVIVAVGLQGSNGSVKVRTTTPSATTAAADPQCRLGVKTLPAAQVPPAVAAWAGNTAVVGDGELWSVRRNLASGPIHDGSIYRLKIGWFTTPFGIPTIYARRLDAQGHVSGDANEAIDQRGKWVASTIELPAAGCWEITATYKQSTIVFRRLVGNPPRPLAIATITGRLVAIGGPAPGSPRSLTGTAIAANDAPNQPGCNPMVKCEILAAGATDAHGRFRIEVPAGTYTVNGQSPQYLDNAGGCSGGAPITIAARQTKTVTVVCSID